MQDDAGIKDAYDAMSDAITAYRCNSIDDGQWRKNLDRDNKRRKKK
jgi:hypothetical protein